MNEEEIREYIIAKRNQVSSCAGLSKYFIGRHKTLPVYLTPQFEREFNFKMCELEKLKEQLEASEKVRKEGIKYCNVVIKNVENLDLKIYPKEFYDLLSILDIDKGE